MYKFALLQYFPCLVSWYFDPCLYSARGLRMAWEVPLYDWLNNVKPQILYSELKGWGSTPKGTEMPLSNGQWKWGLSDLTGLLCWSKKIVAGEELSNHEILHDIVFSIILMSQWVSTGVLPTIQEIFYNVWRHFGCHADGGGDKGNASVI